MLACIARGGFGGKAGERCHACQLCRARGEVVGGRSSCLYTATRRKSSLGGKDRLPIGPPQGLRPAPGTDKVAPYTEGGKEIE